MLKKAKRVVLWVGAAVILYALYIGISLMFLPSVDDLKVRSNSMTIKVKDWKGNYRPFEVGPKNKYWTPAGAIPAEMKWAVILAEDPRFYKHEGVDVKAIKYAIKNDLEKKRFATGASTITQQLAKNLYLSREKTISRKIKEIILAKRIEQELTKGRIIELYLNVVELGPMVYGVGHGARYYFGKSASELTPRECAFLAAMLPGPRVAYNPYKKMAKVVRRSDNILQWMNQKGVLSDDEYRLALAEQPNILRLQKKVDDSIKKVEAFANTTGAVTPESSTPNIPQTQEPQPAPTAEVPPSPSSEQPAVPAGSQ